MQKYGLWAARGGASAGLIALCGLAAVGSGSGLLFPSLGPTAMGMAVAPEQTSPGVVGVSHGGGVLAAMFSTGLTGLALEGGAAVLAPALATLLTVLWQLFTGCRHAPAVATTLLLAGGIPGAPGPLDVCVGVVLLTVAGEPIRRFFLRVPIKEVSISPQ